MQNFLTKPDLNISLLTQEKKKKSPLWWYFERNDALGRLRKKYLHTCTPCIISYLWHKHQQTLSVQPSLPIWCCDCRIISQVPSKGYCWAKVSHGTAWHPNPRWPLRKVAAIPLGRVVYQWHCSMWTGAGSQTWLQVGMEMQLLLKWAQFVSMLLKMPNLWGWTRWSLWVPSNREYSVIL